MTFAEQVLAFTRALRPPDIVLPPGFEWLFPYNNPETMRTLTTFYQKYYTDNQPRTFIFGINPGRFGAGLTGVPFTDPIRLASECGIENAFLKKPELSSIFVWQFINAYGGAVPFCRDFYITSLSPLGFVKDGKNINYYDDRHLQRAAEPFIVWNIRTQLDFGARREAAICLGEGQNFSFFQKINAVHGFFQKIIPLPHPRWVMQYRRKRVGEFVERYVKMLQNLGGQESL
jgi:uracil-DNA glycosylase